MSAEGLPGLVLVPILDGHPTELSRLFQCCRVRLDGILVIPMAASQTFFVLHFRKLIIT